VAGWGASEWWTGRHAEPAVKLRALPAPAREHKPTGAPSPTLNVEQGLPASPPSGEPKAQTTEKATPAPAVDRSSSLPALANSSALAAEAQALEQVLVKLRREHDAAGALALLDEAEPLFVHGTLALEAQVARVDALLLLSRQGEALQILERLPFAQIGRGAELRLVRAELRALDDCGRAISDFDVLVSQLRAPALMERALYGRAACELQLGEQSQAARDFKQYLTRFPDGRFAERVQHQLARLSGKVR
jgi:TolA-binding protein